MFLEVLSECVDFMIKLNNYAPLAGLEALLNKIRERFLGRKTVE